MGIEELYPLLTNFIIAISSGLGAAFILFLYMFRNPEKIEKWGSILFKVGAFVSEKSEKRYMATNIQSTISEKRKELGLNGDVIPYGLNIKWTEESSVEVDLKENNVVIMLKKFDSQSKNLANVISLYVPKALLPRARNYIDNNLVSGIDFIIGKNFLSGNTTALEYYVNSESSIHAIDVKEYIPKIDKLNSTGRLSRILIQEFKNLNSLYPLEPTQDMKEDSKHLFESIYDFEILEPGSLIEGSGIYVSDNFKMAIVPVGRSVTLYNSGTDKHLIFILEQIPKGIRNFYVVGAGDNIFHAKSLIKRVCKVGNINLIHEEEYNGLFRGTKQKLYCALLSVS